MRSRFDEQLAELNHELISMGALCERAIAMAAEALIKEDPHLAQQVIPLDDEIDQKERSVESMCLKLLLHQQPVARDLRQISAALKMVTDMERIGDQAADIAEIMGYLGTGHGELCAPIAQMARETIRMVTESVDAFVESDLEAADAVIQHDDVVDGLFNQVKKAMIDRIAEDPQQGEYIVDLMMIAKYFERIGDHAVNIAEWVVFSVTGTHRGRGES